MAFMVLSALHIQQSHGMIERHISVFVLPSADYRALPTY